MTTESNKPERSSTREPISAWVIAAASLTLAFLVAILGVAFAFGELRGDVKALSERMDREIEVRNKHDDATDRRIDAIRDYMLHPPKNRYFGELEGRD